MKKKLALGSAVASPAAVFNTREPLMLETLPPVTRLITLAIPAPQAVGRSHTLGIQVDPLGCCAGSEAEVGEAVEQVLPGHRAAADLGKLGVRGRRRRHHGRRPARRRCLRIGDDVGRLGVRRSRRDQGPQQSRRRQ